MLPLCWSRSVKRRSNLPGPGATRTSSSTRSTARASIKTSVGRRSRSAATAEEKTRIPCGRHQCLGVATSACDANVIGPRNSSAGTGRTGEPHAGALVPPSRANLPLLQEGCCRPRGVRRPDNSGRKCHVCAITTVDAELPARVTLEIPTALDGAAIEEGTSPRPALELTPRPPRSPSLNRLQSRSTKRSPIAAFQLVLHDGVSQGRKGPGMWAQLQRVSTKPDREAELLAVLDQLHAIEQADSGLLRTTVMRSPGRSHCGVYVLVVFESEEKARAREQDPRPPAGALSAIRAAMGDVLDGPPEFVDLKRVAGGVARMWPRFRPSPRTRQPGRANPRRGARRFLLSGARTRRVSATATPRLPQAPTSSSRCRGTATRANLWRQRPRRWTPNRRRTVSGWR